MFLIILRILLLIAVVYFVARLARVTANLLRSSKKDEPRVPPGETAQRPYDPKDVVEGRWKDMND